MKFNGFNKSWKKFNIMKNCKGILCQSKLVVRALIIYTVIIKLILENMRKEKKSNNKIMY